jgi:TetR/AcrR family transcriptional regulator, transcriptional repressor of aconitase
MPKIVDHDSYRLELAQKAAHVFSKHGYTGLGMRTIAREIGVSKSALYHYFDSKEDLFAAATGEFLRFDNIMEESEKLKNAPLRKRVDAFFQFIESLEESFPNELALLVDYLRDKTPEEIRKDDNMLLSHKSYYQISELLVGKKHALPVLCLMEGMLLQRYLDGKKTNIKEIKKWVIEILEK